MNVTCLMITRNRIAELRQSIICFDRQNYSPRDLLIMTHGASSAYRNAVERLVTGRSDIRCVHLPESLSLGALRNTAVQEACGPLVCQWDDDDLFHPARLRLQIDALLSTGADAIYLRDQLHLFRTERQLFWCDWSRSIDHVGIPNTLLAHKAMLPRYNDVMNCGEDSELQYDLLRERRNVRVLTDVAYLNIYVYHGANLCSAGHHRRIVAMFGLPRERLLMRANTLAENLTQYPMLGAVDVCDSMSQCVFKWKPPLLTRSDAAAR